jgi:hypothetical protein
MNRNTLAALALTLVTIGANAQESAPDPAQKAFFAELSKLCGSTFEGKASVTPENRPNDPFLGQKLVMHVASCTADEIRIPFAIGENRSRTWIIRYDNAAGLSLKHDHRHADGTLDGIRYGGIARNGGSAKAQYFPTDPETGNTHEITKTNVWMMKISEDGQTFNYDIDRFAKPLYRVELRKAKTAK